MPSVEEGIWVATYKRMRNAIGLVIVLWALSQFFSSTFEALDDAGRESLKALEAAAITSQLRLMEQRD